MTAPGTREWGARSNGVGAGEWCVRAASPYGWIMSRWVPSARSTRLLRDHECFESRAPRCVLLVYVDVATSRWMHMHFVPSESTFDYFESTRQHIEDHPRHRVEQRRIARHGQPQLPRQRATSLLHLLGEGREVIVHEAMHHPVADGISDANMEMSTAIGPRWARGLSDARTRLASRRRTPAPRTPRLSRRRGTLAR
jgi:hypothetical protein